jgi:prophage antirepressor-like protein
MQIVNDNSTPKIHSHQPKKERKNKMANDNKTKVLHTFYFEGQKIRIVMKDGNPWFVLDDVCKALRINSNELTISKINLNNLKGNLIDFNFLKNNNGGHTGK